MKAVILKDLHDNKEMLSDLQESLKSEGVEPISMDWGSLLNSIYHGTFGESILLYQTVEMRINKPKDILDFHNKNGFAAVYYGDHPIIINPNKIFFESYRFYAKSNQNNFHLAPETGMGKVHFKKPLIDPPRILMHAGNRLEYLKMTFNALVYSLVDFTVPISLLLNNSPANMVEFAMQMHKAYPNIEILYTDKNPIYAGINLLLQYYDRPKRFIAMEDDIILPQTVKDFFPHWPYLFSQRLDSADVVGWMCDTSNRPMKHVWPIPTTNLQRGWYNGDQQKRYPIMGQCFATTWDHYKKCNEDETFISRDENLIRKSKLFTAPFIKPYHIGWNQQMDGYPRPKLALDYVHEIKNLTNGGSKIIDIRNI